MVSLHACVLLAALAGSNDLVLLDFSADWCVPCREMEPVLQQLEAAGFPVRRVNVDQSPELARQFAIGSIPCFVLVQNGREVRRSVGMTSFEELAAMFHQASPAAAANASSAPAPSAGLPTTPQPPTPATNPVPRAITPLMPNTGAAPAIGRPTTQQTAAPQQLTSIQQLALQATVRVRVTDPDGTSKGTGTIIDLHGDEALILTCGHIFRASQGSGQIEVDLFAPGARGPVAGHLLVYECDNRDFGLISVRPDVPVKPVSVATTTHHPQPGDPIFSVGCDHGADPSVRVSTISAIDRYVGPPTVEIHGHPVEGRSGGGLFTADGQIIGICNSADLQEDRGIYAALPTIHLALDRINQRRIYLRDQDESPGLLADATPSAAGMTAVATVPTPASPSNAEVICVVRAPDGTSRVLVVKNPSPTLLAQMSTESQQQTLPNPSFSPTSPTHEIAQLSRLPSPPTPVVRAQNR